MISVYNESMAEEQDINMNEAFVEWRVGSVRATLKTLRDVALQVMANPQDLESFAHFVAESADNALGIDPSKWPYLVKRFHAVGAKRELLRLLETLERDGDRVYVERRLAEIKAFLHPVEE